MVMDKKPDRNSLVACVFSVKILLISISFLKFLQVVNASCIFTDGQIGECVKFEECRSAIILSQKGVNPGFCSLEDGTVCCTDKVGSQAVRRPLSGVSSSPKWSGQASALGTSNSHDEGVFRGDPNFQRRKHSVGTSNDRNNFGKKKTNADIIEDTYNFETANTFNSNSEVTDKPTRRSSRPKVDQNDDRFFIPPGLAKKKSWRDEKTTENEYFFEHVTKKPNRGPSRKGSNKHPVNSHEPNNSRKWGEINTTRRPQWSDQGGRRTTDDYYNVPNEYESNYSNQRTTTRRNTWGQETYTTTRRPDFFGGGGYNFAEEEYSNLKPSRPSNGNPNRPNVQGFQNHGNNRPNYQQGSQNQGNNRPIDQESSYFEGNRPSYQQGSYYEGNRPNNPQGSYFEGNRPTYQHGSNFEGNRPNSRPGPQKRKRISEQKCEEYSKQVTENITGLPLTTNPDPVIIPVRKCITPQQLIVGGENTTVGEFPHMAAIGFRDRNRKEIAWNCGGTLISDQFVLTAAHCTSTSSGRPVKVRLGEYNLKKNDDGAYPVDYAVVDIITHPDYKPPSKYNDIALLKLSRKVTFFKHIRPACLYPEETFSATKAIATGWGRIFYDGGTSDILQKVVLSIVDNHTCNRLYKVNVKTEVLARGIVDSQLCAGELTGGKDTCQGDSGGPLSITSSKCIHHIIGVTSFGKSCALPNSTGVYTRVSAYVPWIESVVWSTN